jgi:hypothetical protein
LGDEAAVAGGEDGLLYGGVVDLLRGVEFGSAGVELAEVDAGPTFAFGALILQDAAGGFDGDVGFVSLRDFGTFLRDWNFGLCLLRDSLGS